MRAWVGVTDRRWYDFLADLPNLQEVNFWQPGGKRQFRTLEPGELFLFKLHSPDDFIAGGGVFAHSTLLPLSLAWESFGFGNGAPSLEQMRDHIRQYRKSVNEDLFDYTIGCIILTQPFFLARDAWIKIPTDWKSNIVQGKSYDLSSGPGLQLYQSLQEALSKTSAIDLLPSAAAESSQDQRYGQPLLVTPRLGQGAFRVVVTDAYERRCSVTGERVLPVLEVAHIRPYCDGGEHQTNNGLLMRSDLHALFDRGYVTVTPDFHLEVSRRIREEFENGRDYYALHGRTLRLPRSLQDHPERTNLEWHNERIFRS